MNRLYFGDNLGWLRNTTEFPNASVDLVYLDPPFNSNADYNVLFRETSGEVSQAQFHAFTDTWSWADAAETYHQFIDTCQNVVVVEMMEAFHSFLKNSPMMAYLAMINFFFLREAHRSQERCAFSLSSLKLDFCRQNGNGVGSNDNRSQKRGLAGDRACPLYRHRGLLQALDK